MLQDFDPIKWLDDLFAIATNGFGVRLTWMATSEWSGARVEMLLRRFGVKVYARQYTSPQGRDYGVTVRKGQAVWADYILRSNCLPMTSKQLTDSMGRAPQMSWGRPARPVGFAGMIVDWFSK